MSQDQTELDERSSALVQVCSGSMMVRGVVHCRAYIHNNKPKTRHAAQVINAYSYCFMLRDVQCITTMLYETKFYQIYQYWVFNSFCSFHLFYI